MNKKIIVTLEILCMITCMVFFGCGTNNDTYFSKSEAVTTEADSEATETASSTEEYDYPICVYVCGEVRVPGVYELPQGSRVCDAIDAAGGFTDAASLDYWNQAEALTDGEMLYIPTIDEAAERMNQELGTADISQVDNGKININTASAEQLISISGIGESRAQSIIAYREQQGFFETIEDIKNVSGIGNSTFENIKDYISVN